MQNLNRQNSKRSLKLFLLIFLLPINFLLKAQEAKELDRADAYKIFIGRIIATNNNACLTPSVVFTFADKSSLDLAMPLYPLPWRNTQYNRDKGIYEVHPTKRVKYEDNRIFFFVNASI